MRWIVASVVALIGIWGFYVSSPYYALYRLARSVEAGNVADVAARVNVRALRFSLAKQIAAELAAQQPVGGIASQDAQLAAGAALAIADPLLDGIVKPEGLVRLLQTSPSGETSGGTVFGRAAVGFDDLDDFLGASTWRGFRNVYILLPPGEAREQRFRLQLRLGNGRWRLVSLDLPPKLIQRIATELRKRVER